MKKAEELKRDLRQAVKMAEVEIRVAPGITKLRAEAEIKRIIKEIELKYKYQDFIAKKIPYTDIEKAIYNAWQKNKRSIEWK